MIGHPYFALFKLDYFNLIANAPDTTISTIQNFNFESAQFDVNQLPLVSQLMDSDLFEYYSFQMDVANNPEIAETIAANFPRLIECPEQESEKLKRQYPFTFKTDLGLLA